MNAQWSVLAAAFALGVLPAVDAAAQGTPSPTIKSLRLEAGGKDYVPLLGGPPDTARMRSGLVVLAPGKTVGRHSTQKNEEIVIVFEGRGEMRFFNGQAPVPLAPGLAAYVPPQTEHDVINTGDGPLRYIFVVSRAID